MSFEIGKSTRKWTYDKGLLKNEPTKEFEDKLVVLTKDADYFIDEEGIMWEQLMCNAYPDEIKWEGNYEPQSGTVAYVVHGFIEGVLFALDISNNRPFAVNMDSVQEISGEDMEEDGEFTGTIIVNNTVISGEFKTSYGMVKHENGFGKPLCNEIEAKEVCKAIINLEKGMFKYATMDFVVMQEIAQIIEGQTPLLVYNKKDKTVQYSNESDFVKELIAIL